MLSSLKTLKDDMVSKEWTICSFIFEYKEIEYIVLVKRFVGTEKRVNRYKAMANKVKYNLKNVHAAKEGFDKF